MKTTTKPFDNQSGSLMVAMRHQLAYQREKQVQLERDEEYWTKEAERAKADPFYQIGSYDKMSVGESVPISEPDVKPGSLIKAFRAYRKYREEKLAALETKQEGLQ